MEGTPVKKEDAAPDVSDVSIKKEDITDNTPNANQFTIKIPQTEFDIYHTLRPGQSFTWKELTPNAFRGVISGNLVTLEYMDGTLTCTVLGRAKGAAPLSDKDVRHYLRLDVSLEKLDKAWRHTGTPLGTQYLEAVSVLAAAPGVRLLRQDPVETLFSFICSQNNNVKRIFRIVQRLRAEYGTPITTTEDDGEAWHDFPTLDALAAARPDVLKEKVGLGYRAPYIAKSAQVCLEKGGRAWLEGLAEKEVSWAAARKELQILSGVGPKVADCVCLYGLGKLDVAPVDVHVFSIAKRAGVCGKKCTSLTQALIEKIGDAFKETFGEYAGWAQAVMFTAEIVGQSLGESNNKNVKDKLKEEREEDEEEDRNKEEEEEESKDKIKQPKRKKTKRSK